MVNDKPLGLLLTQTILGLFEGMLGAISLVSDSCELFAQIPIVFCALLGFAFPLSSALSERLSGNLFRTVAARLSSLLAVMKRRAIVG